MERGADDALKTNRHILSEVHHAHARVFVRSHGDKAIKKSCQTKHRAAAEPADAAAE